MLEEEIDQEEGEQKQNRRFHSFSDKIEMYMQAQQICKAEKTMSWKAFCWSKQIDLSQLRRWTKNLGDMKKALDQTFFKKTKKVCTTGHKLCMEGICDESTNMGWSIACWWQNCVGENGCYLGKKDLTSIRRLKSFTLFASVWQFLATNYIVLRATTHISHKDPTKQ